MISFNSAHISAQIYYLSVFKQEYQWKLHNFVGQLFSVRNFAPHYKLVVDGR